MSKHYTSEDQIQLQAEALMDALDHKYLKTAMTKMEYDLRVEEINKWEKARLKELKQYAS
jgi:hypothetical protein